jgi:hypothetical protein
MKASKVSALWSKRGLRRVSGAEPPIEAVPQLTDTNPNNQEQLSNIERKTDTMKTYILRGPKPVEPQKSMRLPPSPLLRTLRLCAPAVKKEKLGEEKPQAHADDPRAQNGAGTDSLRNRLRDWPRNTGSNRG